MSAPPKTITIPNGHYIVLAKLKNEPFKLVYAVYKDDPIKTKDLQPPDEVGFYIPESVLSHQSPTITEEWLQSDMSL